MLKAVCQNTLPFHSHRKITARFDGGSLTSDAGWLLFGSLDRQHRLCEGFSSCIAESRDRRYVRHDLLKLIRQRVLQIVAGYEDCNDADTLRSDPMLKTVCDQLPESDPDLATQPTFSRLENSVTKKDLMRLSRCPLRCKDPPEEAVCQTSQPRSSWIWTVPTTTLTTCQQEFSFYHGARIDRRRPAFPPRSSWIWTVPTTTLTANRSSPSTTGITETTFCILC